MRKLSRRDLREHLPLLCVSGVVLYALLPKSYADLYALAPLAETIEVLTYLFSFPLGPLCAYNLNTGSGSDGERFLLWATALAAGYVQWFHLAPALLALREPAVLTLNLAPPDTVAHAPAHAPAPPHAPRLADTHPPPVPPYDARGHTPLERIMMNDE